MPELKIEKLNAWERITQPRIHDEDGNAQTSDTASQVLHVTHGTQEFYFVGHVAGEERGGMVESLPSWEFFWRYDTEPNPPPPPD